MSDDDECRWTLIWRTPSPPIKFLASVASPAIRILPVSRSGDIIRIFNERGACLAAVHVTDGIAPGVVQPPTGAWCDPMDPEDETPLCVHGNPNVLTRDIGTSPFAQGCTGQLTTVEVERFNGNCRRSAPSIRCR